MYIYIYVRIYIYVYIHVAISKEYGIPMLVLAYSPNPVTEPQKPRGPTADAFVGPTTQSLRYG